MGSELVSGLFPLGGSEADNDFAPVSYSELFYKHLPFYLAIGMPYEQYWNGDCELVKYYREAHKLKRKEKNQEMWLQGKYFYDALCCASPILRAFPKNGTKPEPYTKEPYPLSVKEIKEREEQEAEARYLKQVNKVLTWARQVNDNAVHTKGKGE